MRVIIKKEFDIINYISSQTHKDIPKVKQKSEQATQETEIALEKIFEISKKMLFTNNSSQCNAIMKKMSKLLIDLFNQNKEVNNIHQKVNAITSKMELNENLISRVKRMISRFEQIEDNSDNIELLITKLIKEENLISLKNMKALKVNNNAEVYFYIEPIIDFKIKDKIVIIDTIFYPVFNIDDFKALCKMKDELE